MSKSFRKEAVAAVWLAAVVGGVACNDATAMGRAPAAEAAPAAPNGIVLTSPDSAGDARLSAGPFSEGRALGLRNGTIIVNRLKARTVDLEGCSAIPALQTALIKVSRSIRPPVGSDDALVRGFFLGYLDAVKTAIRDARHACDVWGFSDGEFAGDLVGSVLCQVSTVSVDVVKDIVIEPLYNGWSGGSSQVLSECRSSAQLTLTDCGQGDLLETLSLTLDQSCSDSTL